MDTSQLSGLIAQYEYGQFNILDNGMQITYNSHDLQVRFDPFYQLGSCLTRGSCAELMSSVYLDIKKNHPTVHVLRVTGNDPNFFRNSGSNHCFLFVSEEDLMGEKYHTSEPEDIEKMVSKNPLVVDPSFQKVVPLSDSGYKVKRLMNKGCRVSYSNTNVLNNHQGVPLAINSQGEMVYLMVNFNFSQLIDIGVQEPGKEIFQYRLDDANLDKIFRDDPHVLEIIELLRQKDLSETKQNFQVENDIVIV